MRKAKGMIAADIGGTHTTIGYFLPTRKGISLKTTFSYETKRLANVRSAVADAMMRVESLYSDSPKKACLAIAGPLNHDRSGADMPMGGLKIRRAEILRCTTLEDITLLNDIEAVGHYLPHAAPKDYHTIKPGRRITCSRMTVIGAGTGLGCSLVNPSCGSYEVMPSEAGHSDFCPQTDEEYDLVESLRDIYHTKRGVSWHMVLTGRGVENIYEFVRTIKTDTKAHEMIDASNDKAAMISKYRHSDPACKAAFKMIGRFYGRFAKLQALETLPYSGIYITGGVALHNQDIFGKAFLEEFLRNEKMGEILRQIPIYLVTNPRAGLMGAANHLRYTSL